MRGTRGGRESVASLLAPRTLLAVRHDEPLLDELRRLREDTNAKRRGYGLEELVARLFRGAHFRVELDAGIAKPRQTDLVAEGGGHVFLIETKWTARRAGNAEIDSLRARLGNAQSGVIGVLLSVSGFTGSAIGAVETHRDRPILLLDGNDLEEACGRDNDFRRMLRSKQDALLLHGEVLVGARPLLPRRSSPGEPLDGDAYLLLPRGSQLPWVTSRGSFSGFTFSRSLSDPDWVPASGSSVTADLGLPIHTVDGVVHAMSELSSLGWATGAGQWSIAQSDTNWHGLGSASLAQALMSWEERYQAAGSIHHTEQVVYQDVCDDGFYTLSFDVDASDRRWVWQAHMSLQLSGIPLDLDPIRELCRTLDVQARTCFRPRTEKTLESASLRGDRLSQVKPVTFVVEDQEAGGCWVCGIVIKNPYYERAKTRRDLPEAVPRPLRETELLLCDLRSWHSLGSTLKYRLELCEWAWTSHALVARVVADWIDPVRANRKRKTDRPPVRSRARVVASSRVAVEVASTEQT